jgi:aquaporin Z
MNPAVTLAFWRLGRVQNVDAFFYIVFQFLGAVAGVYATAAVLWQVLADPNVFFVVTQPGSPGPAVAWIAEFIISFVLMATVLISGSNPAWASRTGLYAGGLVFLYIMVEGPLSGMSMNPARTFGSAYVARSWDSLWIYFTAPVAGMMAAAQLFRISGAKPMCAKLRHDRRLRCIFCGQEGATT